MRCPPAPPRFARRLRATTALQRVRRRSAERRRERALVRLRDAGRLGSGSVALALAAPHLLPPRACRTKVTGTELEKRIAEACSNKVSGAIGRRGQTWP